MIRPRRGADVLRDDAPHRRARHPFHPVQAGDQDVVDEPQCHHQAGRAEQQELLAVRS